MGVFMRRLAGEGLKNKMPHPTEEEIAALDELLDSVFPKRSDIEADVLNESLLTEDPNELQTLAGSLEPFRFQAAQSGNTETNERIMTLQNMILEKATRIDKARRAQKL